MCVLSGLCVSSGNVKGVARIVEGNWRDVPLPESAVLVMKTLDRNLLVNLNKNVVGVIAEH